MALWGSNDNATGNNKPLYANTIVGVGSNSTINGTTANTVYGSVYGVSAEEAANATSIPVTHAGWVAVKTGTGPVSSVSITDGGEGYNTAGYLVFAGGGAGTGLNVSYAIANSQNTLQAYSTNPTWNTISTLTVNNYGAGYNSAITATAQGSNISPATFSVVLGGRAGRVTHEVLVAGGSITGDDTKDNGLFPGT